jgi:hypothetical protein
MKEAYSLALMIALAMLPIASPAVAQTTGPEQPMRVTLYSAETPLPLGPDEKKLGPDDSRAYFSFTSGSFDAQLGSCDGTLPRSAFGLLLGTAGETIMALSAILKAGWNDNVSPDGCPLPELQRGEGRLITNGRGQSALTMRTTPQISMPTDFGEEQLPPRVSPIRNEGRPRKPEPAPVLVQAVPGHLYVIHVVKAPSDFYVLVHVDSLKEGDKCTISWKRIPSP